MKLFNFILFIPACSAVTAPFHTRPFDDALSKRQSSPYVAKRDTNDTSGLQIDLGYSIYEGSFDSTTGLNSWKGIRYAAPPIGQLRWQAPQVPVTDRTNVIQATATPNQCPQTDPNQGDQAAAITYINTQGGSEDCLFLNIYSPPNAQDLPVLVWIHGGGYGFGNGDQDLSEIINANDNGFIGVSIQYRLGAFGFLSSDEVYRFGVPNAGLRDQMFALQWVQSYIELFGGNSSQVTISGESAGAGSVMIHTMAYGGTLGTSLFSNAIAASPYLPTQYNYNDWVPSQSYYAFALSAGCFEGYAAQSPATSSIFQCLVEKDTETLMNASAAVSSSGKLVTWGFLPVTDGTLIQDLPSLQLQQSQLNGLRMLSGNNANEGALFVTPNITTENDLVDFIQDTFPLFTSDDISKTLLQYPSSNSSDDPNALKYATLGNTGPTAINQSTFATGQQQRADNIYAESTFVCPSYWLAEAFSNNGREAYKYQYSVTPSIHMEDVTAYFGPAASNQGDDFVKAFMTIWGNFVMHNNPSISAAIAAGNSTSDEGDGQIANWPIYNDTTPIQINLNQTGGQEADVTTIAGAVVKAYIGPGLTNKFDAVDAGTWEGGRGARCDFWRSMGAAVPE